jgi:hypothetical protein
LVSTVKTPKKVLLNQEIYRAYRDVEERNLWVVSAKQNREFYNNKQWDSETVKKLQARGQSPEVINRVYPIIQQKLSRLTARRPAFKFVGAENSDDKIAAVYNGILEHILNRNSFDVVFKIVAESMLVEGIGYFLAYVDYTGDDGFPEVGLDYLDYKDVFVDPNSKKPDFSDAENIIIRKKMTKEQAIMIYPDYKEKIEKTSSCNDDDNDSHTGNLAQKDGLEDFGNTIPNLLNKEYVEIIERYSKKKYRFFLILNNTTGDTFSLREDSLKDFMGSAYVGIVYADEQGNQNQVFLNDETKINEYLGMLEEAGVQYQVQEVLAEQLYQQGILQLAPFFKSQIEMVTNVGDVVVVDIILPITIYPIVPAMATVNGNPFPYSDITYVKGIQEMINKLNSLIVSHTTTSTSPKVFVEKGSVDIAKLQREWAIPGSIHEFNSGKTPPIQSSPSPLANELFSLVGLYKSDIEYTLGISAYMQGFNENVHKTMAGALQQEENGQNRVAFQLRILEQAMHQLGKVVAQLIPVTYTTQRVFRLLQPDGNVIEAEANKVMYDNLGREIQKINDVTQANVDVFVVPDSTLPMQRFAKADYYLNLYQMGLLPKSKVLKYLEMPERNEILAEMGEIQNLQSQLQQAMEEIKKLRGDLQTQERAEVNSRKRVEVEKTKSALTEIEASAKAKVQTGAERLGTYIQGAKQELGLAKKTLEIQAEQEKSRMSSQGDKNE